MIWKAFIKANPFGTYRMIPQFLFTNCMWWRILRILIGLEQKCKQKRWLVENGIHLVCPNGFDCILSCSTTSDFYPAVHILPEFCDSTLVDFRANLTSLIKPSLVWELDCVRYAELFPLYWVILKFERLTSCAGFVQIYYIKHNVKHINSLSYNSSSCSIFVRMRHALA